MNAAPLQAYLNTHGHPCGSPDGVAGPKTWAAALDYLAGRALGERGELLASGLVAHLDGAAINTPLRAIHFLAQATHETGGFRYLTELGGDAYFRKYEGRADLGNTQPDDGARFRGRGIFQITGRANYKTYGAKVGVDLIAHPEAAAEPDTAVATACAYWAGRGLNEWADRDDGKAITKRINGGFNGLAERLAYVAKLKTAWAL